MCREVLEIGLRFEVGFVGEDLYFFFVFGIFFLCVKSSCIDCIIELKLVEKYLLEVFYFGIFKYYIIFLRDYIILYF